MDIVGQHGYDWARANFATYVERAIKRKNTLITQQNENPTSDRNKSLNLLEKDIGTLLAYMMSVQHQLSTQQAEIDRLSDTIKQQEHKCRVLSYLLDQESERATENSVSAVQAHTNYTRLRTTPPFIKRLP